MELPPRSATLPIFWTARRHLSAKFQEWPKPAAREGACVWGVYRDQTRHRPRAVFLHVRIRYRDCDPRRELADLSKRGTHQRSDRARKSKLESGPSLLTTAACGGLRSSTPDCRPRRALLHLSYGYAAPCGPALLVTQCHERTFLGGLPLSVVRVVRAQPTHVCALACASCARPRIQCTAIGETVEPVAPRILSGVMINANSCTLLLRSSSSLRFSRRCTPLTTNAI